METKDIIFLIVMGLILIYYVYEEIVSKEEYCKCNDEESRFDLWLRGYCKKCGNSDGNWYP